MVGAEEDDNAVGLGVEGGGDVLQGLLDDLLDLGRGDGQVLGEGVVGATVLDALEHGVGVDGRHVGCGCGEEAGYCSVCEGSCERSCSCCGPGCEVEGWAGGDSRDGLAFE